MTPSVRKVFSRGLVIFLQACAGLILLLLATFLYPVIDIDNLGLFILILIRFWACFICGVNGVGIVEKQIRHIPNSTLWKSMFFSALAAAVPLIVLLIVWQIINPIPPVNMEGSFLGVWQPVLAFSSLAFAIFGYSLPDFHKQKAEK